MQFWLGTKTQSIASNWLIGAMVCLLAAPWVQLSVSAGNGWPHNALRHQWLMPIRCHFRDCKALLATSLTHVSGAIASAQTFFAVEKNHCGLIACKLLGGVNRLCEKSCFLTAKVHYRQTDRWTDRHMDRQTDRQTDR